MVEPVRARDSRCCEGPWGELMLHLRNGHILDQAKVDQGGRPPPRGSKITCAGGHDGRLSFVERAGAPRQYGARNTQGFRCFESSTVREHLQKRRSGDILHDQVGQTFKVTEVADLHHRIVSHQMSQTSFFDEIALIFLFCSLLTCRLRVEELHREELLEVSMLSQINCAEPS